MFVVVRSLDDLALARAARYRLMASPAVIGSHPECDLVLEDQHLAARHVRVRFDEGSIVIEPIGGAHVWLRDELVTVPMQILEGEDIQIGHLVLRFRRPAAEDWDDEPTPAARTSWRPATGVPPTRRQRRDVLADDPVEQALLVTLRERPNDPDSRMVYRDWLYDHGDHARASWVRAGVYSDRQREQLLRETSEDWRAVTGCAPIEGCWYATCPGRWNELVATDDDFMRRCRTCRRSVYYCTRPSTIRDALASGGFAAFDLVLDRDEAEAALRTRG